jgi:glucosamine-6-phosphate deaminase
MNVHIFAEKGELGREAAKKAAEIITSAIEKNGIARFVMATGISQFEFLDELVKMDIAWEKTEMFHLDQYIGLSEDHPASFQKYLKERFIDIVKHPNVNLIQEDLADPKEECKRVGDLLSKRPIDIAIIGIGENGHIAFNDPPADFKTEEPYIVVELDEKCRMQQVSEGWFQSIEEVPTRAISMSIRQIMKADHIICICPDKRKSNVVFDTLNTNIPISPKFPASILRKHKNVEMYLDTHSAEKILLI